MADTMIETAPYHRHPDIVREYGTRLETVGTR